MTRAHLYNRSQTHCSSAYASVQSQKHHCSIYQIHSSTASISRRHRPPSAAPAGASGTILLRAWQSHGFYRRAATTGSCFPSFDHISWSGWLQPWQPSRRPTWWDSCSLPVQMLYRREEALRQYCPCRLRYRLARTTAWFGLSVKARGPA